MHFIFSFLYSTVLQWKSSITLYPLSRLLILLNMYFLSPNRQHASWWCPVARFSALQTEDRNVYWCRKKDTRNSEPKEVGGLGRVKYNLGSITVCGSKEWVAMLLRTVWDWMNKVFPDSVFYFVIYEFSISTLIKNINF